MSHTEFVFSLRDLHHGWWQADLSDGIQQITMTVSSIPQEPLLPMLSALRLLLLGARASTCIWWEEPGQYRWLFSHTEHLLQIHIIRFNDSSDWSNEKGQTVLRMECSLLAFAKRFAHQLIQLGYREGKPAIDQEEYQKLKDAITVFEHANSTNRQNIQ